MTSSFKISSQLIVGTSPAKTCALIPSIRGNWELWTSSLAQRSPLILSRTWTPWLTRSKSLRTWFIKEQASKRYSCPEKSSRTWTWWPTAMFMSKERMNNTTSSRKNHSSKMFGTPTSRRRNSRSKSNPRNKTRAWTKTKYKLSSNPSTPPQG